MFKENEQCSLNTSLWMFQSCLVTLWRKSIGRFRKFKAQFIGKCNQFVFFDQFQFRATWAPFCFSPRTIMSTQDMFCNFPNPFHTQSWSLKVPSSTFENFNTNKNSFLSHSFVQKNSVAGAWLVQTGCKQLFGFLSALETLSGIFYRPPSHEEDSTWLAQVGLTSIHSPFRPFCSPAKYVSTAWDDF